MESERESRKRLELEKRNLMEEIESLRNELIDNADISQEIHDREKKREEELSSLKRVVDQTHKDRDTTVNDLRSKHAKEIEELTNQFENAKRQFQVSTKDRQQLQTDVKERDNEIKNLYAYKQDMEKKRRQLETQLQDLQHKFNDSERIKNEILNKSQRSQQDIEALNAAFIEAEQRLQNNERTINTLKQDNQELQENLQDENRQKMNSLTKLRQSEDLINELKDQLDDKEEERHKVEAKLMQIAQQNTELRRQAEQVNIEQVEELRRQLQREKEGLLQEIDDQKSLISKLSKSNQKLTNDVTDLNVELERYRTMVQNVDKQQRIYEKKLQDEKLLQDKLRQERDQNEREIREKETQRLNLLKELEEKNIDYNELDRRYKQLNLQIAKHSEQTDDVGRYIQDLEKNKRNLGKIKQSFFFVIKTYFKSFSESAYEEQKQQIIDLEDELQTSEDARLRLEVNIGALKQQIEKTAQDLNGEFEDRIRSLNKRLKETENELQEEQQAKQQILQQRRKFETDLQNVLQQVEEANRSKEEALRTTRRLQVKSNSFLYLIYFKCI